MSVIKLILVFSNELDYQFDRRLSNYNECQCIRFFTNKTEYMYNWNFQNYESYRIIEYKTCTLLVVYQAWA